MFLAIEELQNRKTESKMSREEKKSEKNKRNIQRIRKYHFTHKCHRYTIYKTQQVLVEETRNTHRHTHTHRTTDICCRRRTMERFYAHLCMRLKMLYRM